MFGSAVVHPDCVLTGVWCLAAKVASPACTSRVLSGLLGCSRIKLNQVKLCSLLQPPAASLATTSISVSI